MKGEKCMNKVSITKWESMLRDNSVNVEIAGLDGVKMTIKHTLSLQESLQFVEDVVSGCIGSGDNQYTPEVRGFLIKSELLSMYTNFNIPTNLSKLYELIYRTDVIEQVMRHIDMDQFNEMLYAIDKRLEHEVRMIESRTAVKVDGVIERMNAMVNQFEEAFADVDAIKVGQTMDSIRAISRMGEDDIVDAILRLRDENKNEVTEENVVALRKTDT